MKSSILAEMSSGFGKVDEKVENHEKKMLQEIKVFLIRKI